MGENDEAWFATVFDEVSPRVFGYTCRRCDSATAQDVVPETFLVARRRRGDIPDQPLPWLLVVARNTIANRHRRDVRQDRLAETVAHLDRVAGLAASAEMQTLYFEPSNFRLFEERDGRPTHGANGHDPVEPTGPGFVSIMRPEKVVDHLPKVPANGRH